MDENFDQFRGLPRPTSLELSEYHLGLLTEERAQAIREYLTQHPHAARQLEILEGFLEDLEPSVQADPLNFVEKAKILIAQLIQSGTEGSLQPVPALIRGEAKGVFQAGDWQIVITIDEDMDDSMRRTLNGLLIGEEPGQFAVRLWHTDTATAVAETTTDEWGNFIIPNLEAGAYELILNNQSSQVEIHIQSIQA